jgi:hypothetical protein
MLKIEKIFKPLFLFAIFVFSNKVKANDPEINLIEKKKAFNFSFNTDGQDKLELNNQYGDIKILHWKNNQVKASVSVTANAPSNSELENFLETVNVNGSKSGNQIKIITQINRDNLSFKRINKDKYTNLRIDYVVYMPENMELVLNNSFGAVTLPEFSAPLNLNLNYCTLTAPNIRNQENRVNLNFGSANISSMVGGILNSNFTNLNLGNLKNVNLKNNNGNFKARHLEDIDGILNYSQGVLGTIKDAVKLKLNYTNDLVIEKIDENLKSLEILSNYSDVDLPISLKTNAEFNIKTNYGSFFVDPNIIIKFIKNSETQNKNKSKISNFYQGQIGKSNNPNAKITVISNFGDVKIK